MTDAVAKLIERLTPTRRYLLRYLEHGPRTAEKRQHIGPLREMEEDGLVARSMLGRWQLTRQGTEALARLTGEGE